MDRAGQNIRELSDDEVREVFRLIVGGGAAIAARGRLSNRDPNTINRAYNVASEFQRRGLDSLDDETASRIAASARYSTSAAYVRRLFLRWRAEQINLSLAHQANESPGWNTGPPASKPKQQALGEALERLAGC